MTTAPSGPVSARARDRGARWAGIVVAGVLGLIALGVGGTLGTWQWDRAHQQASAIEPDPPAPLADVMRPAQSGRGEGRLVEVSGHWADVAVALVPGKEVEGNDAVLLVMPLEVPGSLTGTGQRATLPVLMGWKPVADVDGVPSVGGAASISGYVRGGEGSQAPPERGPIDSAFWLGSLATATLAQEWPAPVYSYLVVSDTAPPGWNPMPPPADLSRLDLRSLTYAAEWWLFGIFGALLAGRFIRDNVKANRTEEET